MRGLSWNTKVLSEQSHRSPPDLSGKILRSIALEAMCNVSCTRRLALPCRTRFFRDTSNCKSSAVCLEIVGLVVPNRVQAAPDPATARHVADNIRRLTLVQEQLAYKVCLRVAPKNTRKMSEMDQGSGWEKPYLNSTQPCNLRPHTPAKARHSYDV